MANLQNTVRRLIKILLSLFFLLIIKALIWNPYGKNPVEPRYIQKDDQFAKYCHTPLYLGFHLVFWCLSWNRHFGTLEAHYEGNDDQFAKYCQTPRNHRFQEVFCCWSSERHFGALTVQFAPDPFVAQNIANLPNIVTGLLFTVFRWSICAYHVSKILESILWNYYWRNYDL